MCSLIRMRSFRGKKVPILSRPIKYSKLKVLPNTRGFTIIELIIVLLLSTIITALMVKYVVSVGTVVESNLRASSSSGSQVALDYMEDDLRRAVSCTDRGYDSPVRNIGNNPYSITFYADPNNSGVVQAITWRLYNGLLQRANISASSGCNFAVPTQSDFVTILSNVDTSNSYFIPVDPTTGLNATNNNQYTTCNLKSDIYCNTAALTVHLLSTTNSLLSIDRTMTIAN